MTPDDFRTLGHRFVDYIADYWSRAGEFPVLSQVKPGEVLSKLPQAPPEIGFATPADVGAAMTPSLRPSSAEGSDASDPASTSSSWDPIFRDLDSFILPALTHWQSPRFFAYFPCNASPPAVLGELLSAGLNVQGMLWATSPACTELETRMLDWLARMLNLPEKFLSTSANGGGVIQGTASEAALVALVAARDRARRALQSPRRQQGGPPSQPTNTTPSPASSSSSSSSSSSPSAFTLYTSTHAHSSIIKSAMIAGLADSPDDREHIRLIDTDADFAMRPDALEAALRADLAAGKVPCFIAATIGTTSTTAVDSIPTIAAAIRSALSSFPNAQSPVPNAFLPWLHIDAAHAGAACICPEHRWMLDGIEHADSFCFNPHKWLLTNFDCDAFWTSDRRALVQALSVTPEYLRNQATDAGGVIDYRDWQIPLGRRFRALKLWFVIRHYGIAGLQAHIRRHVDLAAKFEAWARADPRFEIAAPRTLNLVCFRLRDPKLDHLNRELLDALNRSGRAYLSHTILPDAATRPRYTLRMAIGATQTQEPDIAEAWALIQHHATRLLDRTS